MRTFLIALLLMLFVITPCFAKAPGTPKGNEYGTPDGKTPHVETVCDSETGSAFGLCNAYCEAMDCDSENTYASEKACSKIRDLYQKHTGHDLPCEQANEQPVCPCIDEIPEFAAFLDNPDDFMYCYDTGVGQLLGIGDITYVEILTNGMEGDPTCSYSNNDVFYELVITDEELEICEQLLLDTIEDAGLNCN